MTGLEVAAPGWLLGHERVLLVPPVPLCGLGAIPASIERAPSAWFEGASANDAAAFLWGVWLVLEGGRPGWVHKGKTRRQVRVWRGSDLSWGEIERVMRAAGVRLVSRGADGPRVVPV